MEKIDEKYYDLTEKLKDSITDLKIEIAKIVASNDLQKSKSTDESP